MAKARRRKPTSLDLNMARIEVVEQSLHVDGVPVGRPFDSNDEMHFVHYWLAVNLHELTDAIDSRREISTLIGDDDE